MSEEYGKFSTDWERMPGETIEYRKKVGLFEIIARVEEKLCEKCDEQHPGYVFKTIDNSGKDVENQIRLARYIQGPRTSADAIITVLPLKFLLLEVTTAKSLSASLSFVTSSPINKGIGNCLT
ncbi:MAG: hypothetical protein C5S38_08300 [Candidatus Methanophagaceae archaeon]|nr:MAG: hypothetical protein C5S38_08300 [Methanophagales archaeon]